MNILKCIKQNVFALTLTLGLIVVFSHPLYVQAETPLVGGVGYQISETFPDSNLAQVVADNIAGGDVLAIITQPMIDNLLSLDAQNSNITDLTGISIFTNLTDLLLNDNQLTTIPDNISNLSALTYLNLENNQLTTLPDSIGNLSSLNEIRLSNNQLTALPDNIGNLNALTSLHLRNNQLTSLPDSICNLSNLSLLYLTDNLITALPDNFGNLSNLLLVVIENNQLTSLPTSLGNLSLLLTLFVDNNLLPTNYDTTLAELNIPNLAVYYADQRQLMLNVGLTPYTIKSESDLNSIDLLSLVQLSEVIPPVFSLSPNDVSVSHHLILQNYCDENNNPVDISEYIQNGIVLKSGTLYAQIRATGTGLFPNNSDHAITVDGIRLDMEVTYYKLSFDLNGTTGTIPATQSLIEGTTGAEVTAPNRNGYTFTGWNTNADGSGTKWIPEATPMIAADVTLYAQWQENEKNEQKVLPVTPSSPKTGDYSNAIGFSIILLGAGSILLTLTRKRNQL